MWIPLLSRSKSWLSKVRNNIKQAKGLGFMSQAQKDSLLDNNYKFKMISLQFYAIITMT